MGTIKKEDNISSALFGRVRRAVLGLLFLHPSDTYYVREIVRATKAGQGAVQRELKNLSKAGIIEREQRGKQVHYRANRDCPVFEELQSLMVKTAGLGDVLRQGLLPLGGNIRMAFIYGSMVTGGFDAESDVNLIIIGDVKFGDVVSELQESQEKLSREINPIVYPPDEFCEKLANDQHFLSRVSQEEKIFVIGDEEEMVRLAEEIKERVEEWLSDEHQDLL